MAVERIFKDEASEEKGERARMIGYVYRENSQMPGYYDGRYWMLWKLPMFGCTDPSRVLNEIQESKAAYPTAYIRCLAFHNINQGQRMAFIIQKPPAAAAAAPPSALRRPDTVSRFLYKAFHELSFPFS